MKDKQKNKRVKTLRRKAKVRAKIFGTKDIPRLSVRRSLGRIYAQLIDDAKGNTLASSSDLKPTKSSEGDEKTSKRIASAYAVGLDLAEKAKKVGISKIVFDRGGRKYHGRVKSLADGARTGGLEF